MPRVPLLKHTLLRGELIEQAAFRSERLLHRLSLAAELTDIAPSQLDHLDVDFEDLHLVDVA